MMLAARVRKLWLEKLPWKTPADIICWNQSGEETVKVDSHLVEETMGQAQHPYK